MGQDIKVLSGGLNRDDAPEDLNAQEYISAHNYRFTGTAQQEAGYGTNIESTQKITTERPDGINAEIGNGSFKTIRKAYSINYNTQGLHQILEVDYDTLVETVIFEDLTDTGGEQVFEISPQNYFNDVRLLHKRYLIMTDGFSKLVYFIDLLKLKAGGYGVITRNDFNLLKAQPLKIPYFEYASDSNETSNQLKNKLFQFRTQFDYGDNLRSTWGSYSKRTVPEYELTASYGDDSTKLNCAIVTVDLGSSLVEKIRIGARTGVGGLFLVKEKLISEIKAISDVEIDIDARILEAYNPARNTYSFVFYNATAYEFIDAIESDLHYDNIPQRVGTLEIVNGNILALGDIEEGYERPTTDIEISVGSYNPNIQASVTDPRNFNITFYRNTKDFNIVGLNISGVPKVGDSVFVNIGYSNSPNIVDTYSYTATIGDGENLASFVTGLKNVLPTFYAPFPINKSYPAQTLNGDGSYDLKFVIADDKEPKSVNLVYNIVAGIDGKSIRSLKTNSSYQPVLAHFDEFGRQFPLVLGSAVKTPSIISTRGLLPQIGWKINSLPPVGAVSAQWLLSENATYQDTLQVSGRYMPDLSDDDFLVINIRALDQYVNSSADNTVNYDYTKGDRVSFIYTYTGTSAAPVMWFDNPFVDVDVVSFEISVDTAPTPDVTNYLLKVRKSDLLDVALITDNDIFLEIYTPKKSVGSSTAQASTIFYEVGEQIDIVNGDYAVKEGTITEGDAYYKVRKYRSYEDVNDVIPFLVEDFNFSDYYDSRYWNAGRGRTYNDEVGKILREGSIRYSDRYEYGSTVNNINRFYGERIYGDKDGESSSQYGAITKLQMRGNYLVMIQELKVGHIPVNVSVIEDQAEQQQIAISNTLFNPVRYLPGNIGSGLAKEAIVVSGKGAIYFIDPNNGYPCRDGYDGLSIIDIKMSKFFMDMLKAVDLKQFRFISVYDDFNEEWNLTKISVSSILSKIVFSESNWNIRDAYTASGFAIVSVVNGGSSTPVAGLTTFTPTTNFVGDASVQFSFLDQNSVLRTKNICIDVDEPSTTVDYYDLMDISPVEISTEYESNTVVVSGNDVPVPISVGNGGDNSNTQYSINGGAYTSIAGTVNAGDLVKIKTTSSAVYETFGSGQLFIADKFASMLMTTEKDPATTTYGHLELTEPSPQTGLANRYGVKFTMDRKIQFDTLVWYYYRYTNTAGSLVTVYRPNLFLPANTLVYDPGTFEINDGSTTITGVELGITNAAPAPGSSVIDQDTSLPYFIYYDII